MSKKKTHEEYVKELAIKNPNVKVVEEYIDSGTPILHCCLIHDIFWKTTPGRALSGIGCEECRKEKFRKTRCKTHNQYVEEVELINPDIVIVGQYIDAKTPIDHYCKKHNILWSAYPSNILRGVGCKECGNDKIRDKNIKLHNEYVEDLLRVNTNIDVIEEYKGAHIPILHRCKIDGHTWYASPANILSGKGCPNCQESHGERHIRQWCEKNSIIYIYQKTFDGCKNIKNLPFDFYLPDYNLCIEYDGEQHFRPVDFSGKGEEWALNQFEKIRLHDEIKNQYCKKNNIHLLRIPYYKNIEEELEHFLFI
ncbi:zinc-ribbon domain-containing protein, partial [Intestinibacter sp.]|uniref:zinc-ribbon domain-containing protein n=1 Tax=Intestinibacter sp. TaxID=1965304 RepID=UPI003F15F9D1